MRATVHVLATVSLVLISSAGAAPPPSRTDALSVLRGYLSIDTSNPPGREGAAARFLEGILRREGFRPRLIDHGGGRASLVASLAGDGTQRPIILYHHLDVVPADPAHWSSPPFGASIIDGRIYGRGACDIKTKGVIDLLTLVDLKRRRVRLTRDVIFVAAADEECGSLGARSLAADHRDLLGNAEYLVDEGQRIRPGTRGGPDTWLVAVAQKRALWLTLTFTGRPGHGSIPLPDSAVNRAVRAAHRLTTWTRMRRLRPELRDYVALLVADTPWQDLAGARPTLLESLEDQRFLAAAAERDPNVGACLGDTVAVTMLRGSDTVNTIPSTATLGLDCRLMPDTKVAAFLADLRRRIDDPTCVITVDEGDPETPAPSAPADSDFIRALRTVAARRSPEARVVPMILLSSTDSATFAPLGISCYGFEPYRLSDEEYDRAHGNDEYQPVTNLALGMELLTQIIEVLGARRPER